MRFRNPNETRDPAMVRGTRFILLILLLAVPLALSSVAYRDYNAPYTQSEREAHHIKYDPERTFYFGATPGAMLGDVLTNHEVAGLVMVLSGMLFGGYVGLLGIFLTKPPILDFGEGVAAIWKIALGEDPILDRINSDGDKKCASDEEPGSDEDDADDDNE